MYLVRLWILSVSVEIDVIVVQLLFFESFYCQNSLVICTREIFKEISCRFCSIVRFPIFHAVLDYSSYAHSAVVRGTINLGGGAQAFCPN